MGTVNNVKLDETLLTPGAQFVQIKEKNKAINGNVDFAVVMDLTISEELKKKGMTREFIGKIQKMRKTANLNPLDKIIIFYKFEKQGKLADIIEQNISQIKATIRKPIVKQNNSFQPTSIITEENVIEGEKFSVSICWNLLVPNIPNLTKLVGEEKLSKLIDV